MIMTGWLTRRRNPSGIMVSCRFTRMGRLTFQGLGLALQILELDAQLAVLEDTAPQAAVPLAPGAHALQFILLNYSREVSTVSVSVQVPARSWVTLRCVPLHGRFISTDRPHFRVVPGEVPE